MFYSGIFFFTIIIHGMENFKGGGKGNIGFIGAGKGGRGFRPHQPGNHHGVNPGHGHGVNPGNGHNGHGGYPGHGHHGNHNHHGHGGKGKGKGKGRYIWDYSGIQLEPVYIYDDRGQLDKDIYCENHPNDINCIFYNDDDDEVQGYNENIF